MSIVNPRIEEPLKKIKQRGRADKSIVEVKQNTEEFSVNPKEERKEEKMKQRTEETQKKE